MPTSQRLEALAVANGIRSYRAQVKRNLKALDTGPSALACAEIVGQHEPVPEMERMGVRELLVSTRNTGSAWASALLRKARIHETSKLCDLTERQKGALVMLLRERADRNGATYGLAA